jgi:hypothetical protein
MVQIAKENSGWGYNRIIGALANLGYDVSDQTVGNVLKRHGIAPAPKRSQSTTWKEFIQSHMAVLAGIDFFTVEVLSWRGLVTQLCRMNTFTKLAGLLVDTQAVGFGAVRKRVDIASRGLFQKTTRRA